MNSPHSGYRQLCLGKNQKLEIQTRRNQIRKKRDSRIHALERMGN